MADVFLLSPAQMKRSRVREGTAGLSSPGQRSALRLHRLGDRRVTCALWAPLKGNYAVINRHGESGARKVTYWKDASAMGSIQLVHKVLGGFNEASWATKAALIFFPVGSMQILDHVDAIGANMGIEVPEGCVHMAHTDNPRG